MKVIIQIIVSFISLLLLGTVCKAQSCDSSSITRKGNYVQIPVECYNELAEEYNRMKEEIASANMLIEGQKDQIEVMQISKNMRDSLSTINDNKTIYLEQKYEQVKSENEDLKIRLSKAESNTKSKFSYFTTGFISGAAFVATLKLLLW